MSPVQLVGIAAGAVIAMMLVLWLISLRTNNASIVDPGWAAGLVLIAGLYAIFGDGYWLRSSILAAMVGLWGIRLALYLIRTRIIGHPEEGRYQELRRQWKTNLPIKFLIFFQFQAILDIVLSVVFYFAMTNASTQLGAFEIAGVVLWLVAVAGESLADAQLHRFKQDPANKGKTCQVGLWHYSRHPNFFFEWLIWVSYALYAMGSPGGAWGWLSPALMLYFVTNVTGIPATEAQALRSRGDEYRKYQQTTSAFFPWPPKKQH